MEYEDKMNQANDAKYECLLFDLDDTLYPRTSGLSREVTQNIQEYMLKTLGIEEEKVPELCVSLYKYYGTTMAGLKAIGYNFDYDDFHSFVHGRLPYTMLKPDPVLRNLLVSMPIRKVIFTNADKNHALRVLKRLGLEDCFEGIICFETLNPTYKDQSSADGSTVISKTEIFDISNYSASPDSEHGLPSTPVICKPFQKAYEQVFEIANINPHKTLFFDDSIRNLQTGKRMGLHTVWVGTSHRADGVDYALESIHNIREALPELWEADERAENIHYSGKVSVETTVRA
ncbi:HAD-superfamily hydrolase, subfamily IA, variant 3 [Corchorus capsularis]|uniref:HAD-superfamily hydrolase, subfamily IA, variant 3 n=1 Tax=Corchorus capsularis TaxID=210143 RepID=A0A1R3GVC0_COCAP|nr:HAD-superfamily hydrolase, subfamily IA, variant 3 [Corchorus capsularis]